MLHNIKISQVGAYTPRITQRGYRSAGCLVPSRDCGSEASRSRGISTLVKTGAMKRCILHATTAHTSNCDVYPIAVRVGTGDRPIHPAPRIIHWRDQLYNHVFVNLFHYHYSCSSPCITLYYIRLLQTKLYSLRIHSFIELISISTSIHHVSISTLLCSALLCSSFHLLIT